MPEEFAGPAAKVARVLPLLGHVPGADSVTLARLKAMVQQPGSPNLYWALTDLPNPLVDWHKGVQGGGVMVAGEFRLIKTDAAMTPDEIEKAVSPSLDQEKNGDQQAD